MFLRPQQANRSGRRGLTLFELIVVLTIGLLLVWLLVNSITKARQRALVAALTQAGAHAEVNPDGSVRMLEISRLPPQNLGDNLDRLARLRNLYAMNLDHAAITRKELEPVLAEMDLCQLHMVGTDISDDAVDVITRQKQLEALDVRATFLSDDGIRDIAAGLPRLRNLRVAETWITDAGLQHLAGLSDLEILDIRQTDISDDGLIAIREFPSLQVLRVNGTRITPEGARALKRDRPALRIETGQVQPNVVTSFANAEFIGLRFLQRARQDEIQELLRQPQSQDALKILSRAQIAGCLLNDSSFADGIEFLPRLRLLQYLRLWGDWIDDDMCAGLWKNHRLRSLDLENTSVTDACLEHVARCRTLMRLNLDGSQVTGEGLGQLSALPLGELHLRRLTLSDAAYDELAKLKSLQHLTLPISTADTDLLLKLADLPLSRLRLTNRQLFKREIQKFFQKLQRDASTQQSAPTP